METFTLLGDFVVSLFFYNTNCPQLPLDKTFIYEYNSIGNLTAVKSYNYTTGAVSGTPGTTALGYTNDKLTTFGSKAITYNSNGGKVVVTSSK